jgi:hypothetical protein
MFEPDVTPIIKGASISECHKYRYRLTRWWGPGKFLPFVMLNPSTADASIDDPTIRRCMSFARRESAGGIVVVNLFAFRATSPKDMMAAPDRHGPGNERAMFEMVSDAVAANMPVVCAWGAGAKTTANFTIQYLQAHGACLVCLGTTKDGHPRHPLYVKSDQPLEPFPTAPAKL